MKKWMGIAALVGVTWAEAQSNWFTVAGNPSDPTVDTVQVDPVSVRGGPDRPTMNVRVSRAIDRRNWEGVAYRSYESEVTFDCRARQAHYRQASFYAAPLWQGTVHARTDYSSDPKPMLFKSMAPNPTQRIVGAACRA